MNRLQITDLLIDWGWLSLGNFLFSFGEYVINIETYGMQRGFMVTNKANKGICLWVDENDLSKNIAIMFFMQNYPKSFKARFVITVDELVGGKGMDKIVS